MKALTVTGVCTIRTEHTAIFRTIIETYEDDWEKVDMIVDTLEAVGSIQHCDNLYLYYNSTTALEAHLVIPNYLTMVGEDVTTLTAALSCFVMHCDDDDTAGIQEDLCETLLKHGQVMYRGHLLTYRK